MHFGDTINKCKDWDKKSPYIAENELFMDSDLTENDVVVRQINVSYIISRLLSENLKLNDND
jgi:hypothetical protein